VSDRALSEELLGEFAGEDGIPSANPFQEHGHMLHLLVSVVGEDSPEFPVLGGVYPLLVGIDRLQLLDEGVDRLVKLERLLT